MGAELLLRDFAISSTSIVEKLSLINFSSSSNIVFYSLGKKLNVQKSFFFHSKSSFFLVNLQL
jgi:hypothetical protein